MQFQSENINELVTALSVAQGEIGLATKDSKNPHFKSDYSSLEACILASKSVLAKNGLAVIQGPFSVEGRLYLITTLAHSSGQWVRSETPILNEKQTAQGMGAGITYARRYALSAIIGLGSKDDDGNEASFVQSDVSNTGSLQKPHVPLKPARSSNGSGEPGAYVLKMGLPGVKGKPLSELSASSIAGHLAYLKGDRITPAIRDSYSGKADRKACEAFLNAKQTTPAEADLFGDTWPTEQDAPHGEELPF